MKKKVSLHFAKMVCWCAWGLYGSMEPWALRGQWLVTPGP